MIFIFLSLDQFTINQFENCIVMYLRTNANSLVIVSRSQKRLFESAKVTKINNKIELQIFSIDA
jgi:short-subunit dehydrogenase